MKPFYINLKFIAFGLLTFVGMGISNITAQTSITAAGTPIIQNFNGIYSVGSWADNSTLDGWYVKDATGSSTTGYLLSDGDNTFTGLASFGTIGSNDRALGFVPIGNVGDKLYVGWRFVNNTGSIIGNLNVQWTGEQWRDEDNSVQVIDLFYQISSNAITSISGTLQSTTNKFSTPINIGISNALDGNATGNRVLCSYTISDPIPPNSEIMIIWRTSDVGLNHLMGIDDVSVTPKIAQTITFDQPSQKIYGDPSFSLGATASSLLSVNYTSSNTNIATVSVSQVSISGPGVVDIIATQSGNANYAPALNISRSLEIKPKTPVSKAATSISTSGFTANWTADNGTNDSGVRYLIEYANNVGFSPKTVKSSINKNYSITGLTANTIYYYRIYSQVSGTGLSSDYTASSAITTGSDYRSNGNGEWTGSNLWTVKSGLNWVVSPTNAIANSIEIAHNCLISSGGPITTNSLLIRSNAKLTTSQQITVTNELIIEVAANGSAGQILNSNNIIVGENAKITVRKTFATGWNFIGFPFTVTDGNIFRAETTTPLTWGILGSGDNFIVQQYNGDARANLTLGNPNYTGNGVYWGDVSPKEFTAKKGYIVYNNSGDAIDFTSRGSNIGTFFSRTGGATVPAGLYSSSAEHRNWNLIASPLSSIYDLAYTSPSTSYYAFNGTNYLPALAGEELNVQPFSAFFLQAPSTSINFNNIVIGQGRKVAALARSEEAPVDDIRLTLSNGNTMYDDMTRIRLQDGASAGYEIGTDAAKIFGMNPNVSYIYTSINRMTAAINTLPTTVTEVELTTKFASAGNYSISISNIEKVQNYSAVVLVDKTTGKRTDLLSVGSYDYNVGAAGTINRFKVQFAPKITTGVSLSGDQSLRITSQQGNATISGLSAATPVRVYDTTGKTVFSGLVINNEPIRFENKGLYIFEITTPEKTEKIKSFVR